MKYSHCRKFPCARYEFKCMHVSSTNFFGYIWLFSLHWRAMWLIVKCTWCKGVVISTYNMQLVKVHAWIIAIMCYTHACTYSLICLYLILKIRVTYNITRSRSDLAEPCCENERNVNNVGFWCDHNILYTYDCVRIKVTSIVDCTCNFMYRAIPYGNLNVIASFRYAHN